MTQLLSSLCHDDAETNDEQNVVEAVPIAAAAVEEAGSSSGAMAEGHIAKVAGRNREVGRNPADQMLGPHEVEGRLEPEVVGSIARAADRRARWPRGEGIWKSK